MAVPYKETRQGCGHYHTWAIGYVPKIGENVFCPRCNDMRKVRMTPATVIAMCRDCEWWQRRQKRDTIMSNVEKHLEDNQTHTVIMEDYHGEKMVARWKRAEDRKTLF